MVFSQKDIAVIENEVFEHGWSTSGICKEHPSNSSSLAFVKKLLKKITKLELWKEEKDLDVP